MTSLSWLATTTLSQAKPAIRANMIHTWLRELPQIWNWRKMTRLF